MVPHHGTAEKTAHVGKLTLDLPRLAASVGDRSRASLFRDLSTLPYLSSYTHSGSYYTLRDIPDFDPHGLWFFHDIGFSRVGTLRATIAGLVDASKGGYVHEELASLVRVRVHNTLRDLALTGQIRREGFRRHYIYLSADLSRAEEQREIRAQRVAGEIAAAGPTAQSSESVQRETIIAVLVEALHVANMRVNSTLVAKRLEVRGLFVSPEQVEQILGRYGLGKKKARAGTSLELVQGLRRLLRETEGEARRGVEAIRGSLVRIDELPGTCPLCGGPMKVQKTRRRGAKTLEWGEIDVVEPFYVCATGCRDASGTAVTRRSSVLSERLLSGRASGYDLMTWVGLERFAKHRQRREIQRAAEQVFGIRLSEGAITDLAHRFIECLEALHLKRAPILAAALAADGGWPLHVDATGEDGRGMLLVIMAGWRRWILGGWRISTECEEQILPHLRTVCRLFGQPCACMRDLGRAMIPALQALVRELGGDIRLLSCHLHFLKDIGKDLLDEPYAQLREFFRASKMRPNLRALARELGRTLGSGLPGIRQELEVWLAGMPRQLPSGPEGLGVVRALAQWVLDYPVDGENLRFPFDRPYLDLYQRTLSMRRALDDLHRHTGTVDPPVRRALERLMRTLDSVASSDAFRAVSQQLESRGKLFDNLRNILRVAPDSVPEDLHIEELDQVRRALRQFRRNLQQQRPARGPAQDTRDAIDLVEQHLARHGDSLWGHVIALPEELGGGIRIVARTNNLLEAFFQLLKQGERRRSGRKNLGQDLEHFPASAVLVSNLSCPDYVKLLCGSLDELPSALARLDADNAAKQGNNRTDHHQPEAPPWATLETASLPKDDRSLFRSPALDDYILAASRSRAPRVTLPAH